MSRGASTYVMVGVITLGVLFLIGYLTLGRTSLTLQIETEDPQFCLVDTDCVPAQCCHATSSVNARHAPDCTNVLCTLECRPGTLDCNQGEIRCASNRCVVIINISASER